MYGSVEGAKGARINASTRGNGFGRVANGGNELVPAARHVRVKIELEDMGGDAIAMIVIVEEPAVDVAPRSTALVASGFRLGL